MKICIVIPVHNEARAIGSLVQKIKAHSLDVLVIDDGSTDDSGAIAQAQGALVLHHEQKQGKGRSLQTGFDYVLKNQYEGLIVMDGDGQHDVGDLDQFLNKAREDPESVIIGTRMHNPSPMPFIRYLTNRVMSWLISRVCHLRIPDTQCGYRYISSGILRQLSLTCSDFEIETEVLMKAVQKNFPIYSVPIKTIYQNEDSKINPFRDTLRFISFFIKEMGRIRASARKMRS